MRSARARCAVQAREDGAQIESAVEQILHQGQVSMGGARVAEGVVGSRESGLQVAQHGVDGQEIGVDDAAAAAAAAAAAGDVGLVAEACTLDDSEAAQAV